MNNDKIMDNTYGTATLGAGCFWCVEAIFQKMKGIISVVPGYSGGSVKNPSYKEVCTGRTGHAEVCRIQFDPDKISFCRNTYGLLADTRSYNTKPPGE